jgi:hypothetical protein
MRFDRFLPVAVVALVFLAFAGCSPKAATDLAIRSAETSYDTVKEKLRAAMPQEAADIEGRIADAKAKMSQGQYRAAVEAIRDVPDRIRTLGPQADARLKELKTTWGALAAGLPDALRGLRDQVERLDGAKHLPAGLDTARVAGARTRLADAEVGWKAAKDAEAKGDLTSAIREASAAQKSVGEALVSLGQSTAAAPDSTPAR